MALSLMFEDVISKFNGKNMKGFQIAHKIEKKIKYETNKEGKKQRKVVDKITFPEYTTDVIAELSDIRYKMSDEASVYKSGEIGEIISKIKNERLPINYWKKDKITEFAKSIDSLDEFGRSSAGNAARKLKIFESIKQNIFNKKEITFKECLSQAYVYKNNGKTKTEFNRSKYGVVANKNNWNNKISSIVWDKPNWDLKSIKTEFLKIKNNGGSKRDCYQSRAGKAAINKYRNKTLKIKCSDIINEIF
jgi:hypothetical protein